MKFERVHHIRLHEQVIARFNEMAEAGHLKADDKLPPERELLQQLGVSRQVLREALMVMETLGMVTTVPGGGRVFRGKTFGDIGGLVDALNESALFEILTAREAIECKIAELAAVNATDAEIRNLRERIATLKASSYTFEWNYEFHLAIARTARNNILHNLLQLLLQARRDINRQDYLTRGQLEQLFEDHSAIINAIEERNVDAAREVMRQHIETTRRAFEQRKKERAKERGVVEAEVAS